MKIFTKTFLYTLGLLLLVALLANGLIYTLMPKIYTDQKQEELTKMTNQFVQQLEVARREEIVDLMSQHASSFQTNLIVNIGNDYYSLLTWNGGVIFENNADSYEGSATTDQIEAGSDQAFDTTVTIISDGNVQFPGNNMINSDSQTVTDIISSETAKGLKTIETRRNFTMEGRLGTVTAIVTLAPVDEAVEVIVSLLPISILMCVIVAVFFSLLYARAITRPIRAISEETQHMTAMEREARCRIDTKDEIGTLALNVNTLYKNLLTTIESLEIELEKVSKAERAKTDFLRAASHELKTPVTAVSVIMDNMILKVGKYKNHEDYLPKCKELVDQLSAMLREILTASHLEDTIEGPVTKSIETLCDEILEPYILIARAKGLILYIDWSAAFLVTVPPKLLSKALSNIFSNAVKYTRSGGKLSIYCREHSLFVENECVPLPEEQLSRLAEPFYRPDESRNRDTGGNGLGLYIADSVLHLIGLDYSLKPMTSPDGMRFIVNF